MGDPLKEAMMYLEITQEQKLKDQAVVFDPKTNVWVATPKDDADGYCVATIKGANGDLVTIEAKGVTKDIKKEECDQMNPPKYEKCTDMANLTYLNEASVLHNLRSRYIGGFIYTYSGLFCIAVNPYRRLPIYNDTVIKVYRGKRRPEVPPHVFAIVDNAYQDMLIDHENQSMLITGESGAGKTENTKKVIQYIAKVAGVEGKKKEPVPGEVKGIKGELDEQIVQTNPLLEAFGNAKTTRNNNSSRFGKFIRCHFSSTGKLAGADIESYLLEKNRVSHQGSQERNYHIFYQILYAASDADLQKYCLLTRESKEYLFLSYGVSHVDRLDDLEEYGLTVEAIKVLGFSEEEHESMFKITAAILNMSNMKFKQKPRDEQAEVTDPSDGERASYLYGINVGEFHKSLCKPKVKVGTEYVNKGQNVTQVLNAVGALAKAIFERMFWWIVVRINKALDTKERRSYFIGVLDIAGFEIFDYNSFDQLCINFTNEKLQQFFNHHMFVMEQEEYKKEGIVWEFIDFGMDLEETINLIEKPMGIFAMLEEECIVPKATDQTYLAKMHKQHGGGSKAYGKPTAKQSKQGMGDFILHHYAGSVGYSVAGWLDKNKDPINENTAQLWSKSTDKLVAHLFKDYDPDASGGRKKGSAFQTVSFRHKEQLGVLMKTLFSTSPHFVRCIIPNENKSPTEMDGQLVLHQLRCNGVLEGIRICRKGFPSRMLFTDFRQRYQILAAAAIPSGFVDGKVAVEKLLEALQLDASEYKVGTTKVFFKSGIVGELEEMRDEKISRILSQFQAYCKGYLTRCEYKKLCDQKVGLAVIQRNVRKFLFLRNWSWWKLYIKVQPLLSVARAEEEMKEKEEQLKLAMENAEANETKRKELESSLTDTMAEKEKIFSELQVQTDCLINAEEKLMQTQTIKDQLESQLNEALEKLDGEEHSVGVYQEKTKKAQAEIEELTNQGAEKDENISRLSSEKAARDKQIDTLNEDIAKADESNAKLSKEKKGLEDNLQERTEQLQATEDKFNALSKAKGKTEGAMKEIEHNLQKEKDAKAKIEKDKRKVEGDLKETKDSLMEAQNEVAATKEVVAKKDKAIKELQETAESNENQIKQLQKKIAELLAKIEELEEELENERKLRQKEIMARKDLESQLEELTEQLEQSGGATTAQVEVSKKREAECSRLKKELEDATKAGEDAVSAIKSKSNQALAEAADELENVKKAKAKSDKEKSGLGSELQEALGQVEQLKKQKAAGDKNNRTLDDQLNEVKSKLAETESALGESEGKNAKASADSGSLGTTLTETEHKLGLSKKENANLKSQLSEATENAESECKQRHEANLKLKDAQAEVDDLTSQLEEEQNARAQLQQKMAKAVAEAAGSRGNAEDAAKIEELEESKKKLSGKVLELDEALAAAEMKSAGIEKVKNRMSEEVDDLMLDLEKAQAQANTLQKKQKAVDASILEWKTKCDEVQAELEHSQKDNRANSTEVMKLRKLVEELEENNGILGKANKSLGGQLDAVTESGAEGALKAADAEKHRRKVEGENEELVSALDDSETALEQEKQKFLKMQMEFCQYRQSSERRSGEREEEFETSRKNHSRQLECLQATIDADAKSKADMVKNRKKYESDIADLEGALEVATRSTGDYQKNIKKFQTQVKEMQVLLDEEARARDEGRDSLNRAERRANELVVQLDEARALLEQSDRSCKLAESQRDDAVERLGELQASYNNAALAKRKAEADFYSLQEEIEHLETDAKNADERAAKAASEVARLLLELNAANEATRNADKSRALLSKQVGDLQGQLEAAEEAGGKTLKNQIKKLEQRIMDLESDLDTEGRKSAQVVKTARKAEHRVKELEMALCEEKKANEKVNAAADTLTDKLRKIRLCLEATEQEKSAILAKYKRAAGELNEAEQRSEAAEAALQKQRQRTRAATAAGTAAGTRQQSRARTPNARD